MIERLQLVLDALNEWLAKAGSEEAVLIPRDELIQWHIALTTMSEPWVELQHASQEAVDAFLMRPPKTESPISRPVGSKARAGQRHYQRLAQAMAELEQALVELKTASD